MSEQLPASKVYDMLYGETDYGSALMVRKRVVIYLDFMKSHVPPPAKVFEVGCGRGLLLRELAALGYSVEGIEVSRYLVDNDLQGFPIHCSRCEDLGNFPSDSADITIANDVLEHLPDEAIVANTVDDLARISRRWLLVSCGMGPSVFCVNGEMTTLHCVRHDIKWWRTLVERHVDIDFAHIHEGSCYLFGHKRDGAA